MRDRKALGLRPWPAPPADRSGADMLAEITRNCEVWKCDALVISGRFCQRHEQELNQLHRMAEAVDLRDESADRRSGVTREHLVDAGYMVVTLICMFWIGAEIAPFLRDCIVLWFGK